ncbi:MAG: DUF58 domain-containing protein [Burkholderiaceae bacterium]|nr:DUF58 domain-containing protein [Burkholderiaceae bacterium]
MKVGLPAALRRRLDHWWQARLPVCDTTVLTQRNVYILPTGAGWMLAVTLLVLLVASINFQLNLGYLLTFLLAGSATVGMHICHATLRGLTLHLHPPEAAFLGHSAVLDLQLTSQRRTARFGIALAVHGSGQWTWTDVPAQGSTRVQVAFAPPRRGLHRVPVLTAETRFPLGTFRVWTLWRPAAQLLVYPAPELGAPPLPLGEPRPGGAGAAPNQGIGDFDGVRAYRRGDPLQLVVWKKAAQALASGSEALVSRDTQAMQRYELWLTPERTGLTAPEARLSRLTAWVLQAERLGVDYGLRLPGVEVALGHGSAQRQRCLQALALV